MKQKIIYVSLSLLIVLNIVAFAMNIISKKNTYIILDSNNIWKITNDNVKKVQKNTIKKLSYSNAKIYADNAENGYFGSINNFKFYNDTLESKSLISNAFIVIGNQKIKNYTSNLRTQINEDDVNIIGKYLKKNNIDYDLDRSLSRAIDLPDETTVYSVESLSDGGPSENGYSIIFIYKNKEANTIYLKTGELSRASALNRVLDLNSDGIPEIVLLSDTPGNAGDECYSLYKMVSDEYKPVINCEED